MEIVETANEGLKRAYELTISAKDIEAKVSAEIKKVAPQVRMPGFRPGKVPANLVKKLHGESIHSEVLNAALRESIETLVKDKALRPAVQPKVEMKDGYEQGKNAELTVEIEILPEIETPSIDGLTLEKLNVPVSDKDLDEALLKIAEGQKSYKNAPKTKKASDGNQLIIDFVGSIDGEEFEGGKAEDAALIIGSGQFIPGFEEQLVGVKTGEEKTISVTFPDDYPAETLKGNEASFLVNVKQVKVESETKIDEDFAKQLGIDSLDKLKELMKGQIEQETAGLTRTQMKRQLLDTLAAGHDFDVPPSMVEAEFEQIWTQLQAEAAKEDDSDAALKEIEDEKDDYKHIAERRVRLGLLLSEIGQANSVEVSAQEMQMLIQQAAQQYSPDDRERFVEYVRNEPMAQAQLRAPMYEDKVVDFLFEQAEVTERDVTREELEAAIEAEDTSEAKPAKKKADAKKKAPAKKAAAKKAPAKKADAKPAAKKAPAKKAAAKPAAKKAAAKPAAKKAPAKKAPAKKKPAAKK